MDPRDYPPNMALVVSALIQQGQPPDALLEWDAAIRQVLEGPHRPFAATPLEVPPDAHQALILKGDDLIVGDQKVRLAPRVIDIITFLARHPGLKVSNDDVVAAVSGTTVNSIAPAVSTARDALRKLGLPDSEVIRTVRKNRQTDEGPGYIWSPSFPLTHGRRDT